MCITSSCAGDLLTFADVAETSRAFNETAIGVIRADGNFTLAPEPTYPLNLQTGASLGLCKGAYTGMVGMCGEWQAPGWALGEAGTAALCVLADLQCVCLVGV